MLVRHCFNVMNIEKNMCTNIIDTLLDILGGKTRDRLKMQEDLVDLKIRSKLAP